MHRFKFGSRTSPSAHGLCLLVGGVALLFSGCSQEPQFESNRVFRFRVEAETDQDQSKGAEAVDGLIADWFGTPDQPRWPQLSETAQTTDSVLQVERLVRSAGPQRSDREDIHYGLYRELCNNCHGLSGDGRGPVAMILDPYPRDFRPGWFKYKSTKRGIRPTRDDLYRIIKHGIPGTSMPSFAAIESHEQDAKKNDDLDAIVDYVIYLSIRGEVERLLLYEVAHDEGLLEGARARLSDKGTSTPDTLSGQPTTEQPAANESPESQVAKTIAIESTFEIKAKEIFIDVLSKWSSSSSSVMVATLPAWWGETAEHEAAIRSGKDIYLGATAACANCHGKSGGGNGLVRDYDDWAKDATVRAGLEPGDRAALKPYLAAGGLKPVPISPRDLRMGIYRGGDRPEDIYRRIVQGIEGTPMPAVALKPDNPQGLTEDEVWQLVAYVMNMKQETQRMSSSAIGFALQKPNRESQP
jgi:mono/diheme cytochrome c family protein